MVLVFRPVVKRIPLASLAAILMITSFRTAAWKSLKLIARWSYGLIMTVTTILTVMTDLTIAVVVGVVPGIGVLVELAFHPGNVVRLQGPRLYLSPSGASSNRLSGASVFCWGREDATADQGGSEKIHLSFGFFSGDHDR